MNRQVVKHVAKVQWNNKDYTYPSMHDASLSFFCSG